MPATINAVVAGIELSNNTLLQSGVQYTTAIVYNPVWWVFAWGLLFLSLFSVILVGTVL